MFVYIFFNLFFFINTAFFIKVISNNLNIVVIVDNDPSSRAINISLLKSLPIVQEVVECSNSKDTFSCIVKNNAEGHNPDILLLDLKTRKFDEKNFISFYKTIIKPQKLFKKYLVIYTPDFSEDNLKIGIPGFTVIEKQILIEENPVPEYFEDDIYKLKLPGFKLLNITEPGRLGKDENNFQPGPII